MGRKKRKKSYIKTKVDNTLFDSKLESQYYEIFKNSKVIEILELQKTFELYPPFNYVGFNKKYEISKKKYGNMVYTPDFVIRIKGIDKPIAVEIKGYSRPLYQMRKKLFIMKYSDEYLFLELMKKDMNKFKEWENEKTKTLEV